MANKSPPIFGFIDFASTACLFQYCPVFLPGMPGASLMLMLAMHCLLQTGSEHVAFVFDMAMCH